MAELHIERKERSSWPWILLVLLLLALLAWWFLGRDGDVDDAVVAPAATADTLMPAATTTAAGGGAVAEFRRWVDDNRARGAADTTHEYTAEGIRALAAAIGAVAQQGAGGTDMQARMDSVRMHADAMQQNASSMDHANHARMAFTGAADLMASVQQRSYPGAASQVSEVRTAATAVQGNRPLLDQRSAVQTFFDRAATALQAMGGTAGT